LIPWLKQISLAGLSQLAVWASAALLLVPILLHRGRIAGRCGGSRCGRRSNAGRSASLRSASSSSSSSTAAAERHAWALASLAGKALVFHAAAMALVEVVVLTQILSTRLRSTKMLFSVATSACGTWASYVVANPFGSKKRTRSAAARRWRMKAPVQDAWMAMCIHVAKLGAHVTHYEEQVRPGDDTPAKAKARIGVVMGTFIIVSVLSAPFVWYDRGAAISATATVTAAAGRPTVSSHIDASPQKYGVKITPRLAMAHVLVAVTSCSLYRAVLLDSVLPFLHGLLPDTVSTIVSQAAAFPIEQRRPLTFGVEMSVLGVWLFALLSWHFPREVPMRRAAAALVAFGACFVSLRPPLDMRGVAASLLSDTGLLVQMQSWENPVTHAPFFYDYLGHRKPATMLWRPWALIVAGAMVVVAAVQIIALVVLKKASSERKRAETPSAAAAAASTIPESSTIRTTVRECASASVFGIVMGSWLSTSQGVSAWPVHGRHYGFYPSAYAVAFTAVTLAVAFFLIKHVFLLLSAQGSGVRRPRAVLHAYALLVALLLIRIVFQEIAIAARTTDAMMHAEDVSGHLSDSLLGSIFTGRKGGLLQSVSWALSLHGCLNIGIAVAARFVLMQHEARRSVSAKAARPPSESIGRSSGGGGGGLRSISSRWQQKVRTFGVSTGSRLAAGGGSASANAHGVGEGSAVVDRSEILATTLASLGRSASVVASGCVLALGLLWHTPESWLLGRELAVFVSALLLFLAPPPHYRRGLGSGGAGGAEVERDGRDRQKRSSEAAAWRLHSDRVAFVFTYVCVTLDMMAMVFDVVFPCLFAQHSGWRSVRNLVTLCGIIPLQRTCMNAMRRYPGCNTFSYLVFPIPMTLVALLFNQSRNEIIVTGVALCVWVGIASKRWRWSTWDF
jgi:hypothetical protein